MAARDSFAPDGTPAAPDGVSPLDNPHLGRRLFGYSPARTNALLEHAATMIEEMASDLVSWRESAAEATARLAAAEDELERARGELARRHDDETSIADALVTAHREAAAIVERGRREAMELLASAQAQASELEAEADHVVEQAEIRAQALVEQAAGEVDDLRTEAQRLRAQIDRERELWTASLRRVLATLDAAGPSCTAVGGRDLGGALQAGIGAAALSPDHVGHGS
jgi:cell division septum initiation protein DivIVA